jgi:hypothetical protein
MDEYLRLMALFVQAQVGRGEPGEGCSIVYHGSDPTGRDVKDYARLNPNGRDVKDCAPFHLANSRN